MNHFHGIVERQAKMQTTHAGSKLKIISEFELINHGIEHSQYFQGCGIAFTQFANVVTGIGDNPAEAIDDCLEQIAQYDFEAEDMKTRIMTQEGWEILPTIPSVWLQLGNHNQDIYYYVSIRYNKGDRP